MKGIRDRRMISRSISTSRKVNRLGPEGALLFTWMCLHCDDYGRIEGDPYALKIKVVPGMSGYTETSVREHLTQMQAAGLIFWYEVNGDQWIEIPRWCDIQSWGGVHRQDSEIPPFSDGDTVSGVPEHGSTCSGSPPQGKARQGKARQGASDDARQKIAELIYERHPRKKGRADAIKSIVKLLKSGKTEAELNSYLDNYLLELEANPKDPDFIIQANNFWGRDARWQDFVAPTEKPKPKDPWANVPRFGVAAEEYQNE
jgi:hypothetical protein